MKLHANAALTSRQRRRMVLLVVKENWSIAAAAAELNTSQKTCLSGWPATARHQRRAC